MQLNPKHKVPLLVVDGQTLTENVAIQLWIARRFPGRQAAAVGFRGTSVKAISIMSWCASGVHPYLSRINSPAKVCDVEATEESVSRIAAEFLAEAYGIAEGMLEGREYFFDHFTAPDAHFFWCVRRSTQFDIDLEPYPNTRAHFARMQTRPSVRKLLAFEKETQASFAA